MDLELTVEQFLRAEECSHVDELEFDELFMEDGSIKFPLLFKQDDLSKLFFSNNSSQS